MAVSLPVELYDSSSAMKLLTGEEITSKFNRQLDVSLKNYVIEGTEPVALRETSVDFIRYESRIYFRFWSDAQTCWIAWNLINNRSVIKMCCMLLIWALSLSLLFAITWIPFTSDFALLFSIYIFAVSLPIVAVAAFLIILLYVIKQECNSPIYESFYQNV